MSQSQHRKSHSDSIEAKAEVRLHDQDLDADHDLVSLGQMCRKLYSYLNGHLQVVLLMPTSVLNLH